MIVVRIELWPKGDESRKREIGVGEIINVGGNAKSGDYKVKLLKSPEYAKRGNVGQVWRSGSVEGFPRTAPYGPWDLLLLALSAALGPNRIIPLLKRTSGASPRQDDGEASTGEVPE